MSWAPSLLIGGMSLLLAPRLIGRFGARAVLSAALVLIASGLGILGQLPADGAYFTDVFPATLPLGIGFGLAMPSLAGLAMSAATPQDSGLASGMFNTVQQVGSSLGLAALSTLAVCRTHALSAGGASPADALTGGYRLAFRAAACLVLDALVVATAVLRTPSGQRPGAGQAGPRKGRGKLRDQPQTART